MGKNRIGLTELQLHRVIKECVRKVLNESQLRRISESKSDKTYRGAKGRRFIWHGEWSDP